jgi:hypothetical protein
MIIFRLHIITIKIERTITSIITCFKTCSSTASLSKLLISIVLNVIPVIDVLVNTVNKFTYGTTVIGMCRGLSNANTLV